MLNGDLFLHQDGDTVFYFDRYDSVFHPLYVFNAQAGAHFYFYYNQNLGIGNAFFYAIDSVWTEVINGDTLRTQQVSWATQTAGNEGVSIVNERFGNMDYLFNYMSGGGYLINCPQKPMGLRCYSDPYFGFYETGIVTDCDDTIPYVSVEEINTENGIKLWPNPVNNTLNIQVNTGLEALNIYNINGQLIKPINVSPTQNQSLTIDITDLPPGIYSLVGLSNQETIKAKFVKH
tara:strand:- start:6338 stop:7036 length:699 start_codon:yes stop_codon:yes gene_type:complete